ncbi:O-antigen ligase family protein [Vibrio sp. 1-Bac 57]
MSAWKDWFKAACWLVLLMSIFQHPDMPKSIANIPGLNHWNFLFLNVVFSWLINRKKEKISWEMPRHLNFLLFFYSVVIVVSVIRYLNDHSGVDELIATFGGSADLGISAINEYLINCFKWVIPAIIIFDGCRSKKQYFFAVTMLALMFFLLALQVVKAMKLGSLTMGGDALQLKALKIISNSVGFHRVNISMIMSGAFWAVFCLKEFVSRKYFFLLIIPGCIMIFLAMALTGGRTGYGTWLILGAFFCLFKWRKYLLLAPVLLFLIVIVAPSAIERLTQGFTSENNDEFSQETDVNFHGENVDMASVTSGRVIAWPLVWESIKEAPFFGSGREAMQNLGITRKIMLEHGEGELFPHPHNAYLQLLQDNGFIGAIPIFIFYLIMVKYSWSLFRDNNNNLYIVTGGINLALLLAFLIASTGSQTFYPREGALGMWVAIGLVLRVYIERNKLSKGMRSSLLEE